MRTTLEGTPVTFNMTSVQGWGWHVAISVTKQEFLAPLHHSLRLSVAASTLAFLLAVILSQVISQRLTGQVRALLDLSRAMRQGETLPAANLTIKEFHDLQRSLLASKTEVHIAHEELAKLSAIRRNLTDALHVAHLDPLTGLPRRALFLENVGAFRASIKPDNTSLRCAMLYIDLDNFKQANDTYGHAVGDDILIRTSAILKSVIRDQDLAARFGGDEFVVCVTAPMDAIEATAKDVAKRVIDEVASIGMKVGCSVGISLWTDASADISDVLERADSAMYEAKRRGRNQFAVYGEGEKSND